MSLTSQPANDNIPTGAEAQRKLLWIGVKAMLVVVALGAVLWAVVQTVMM